MKPRLLASALAVSASLAYLPAEAAGMYNMSRDTAPRINIYQDPYSYVGVDMMNWNFSGTVAETPVSASARGTRFTFGQRFDEFVAAEVQFGIGGTDSGATPVTKMDHTLSVFVKGVLPMNRLQLKGLIGYSASQFEVNAIQYSYSSVSFGLGAELNVWRDAYVNADYIKYVSTTNVDMDAISIGAGYRF